MIFYMGEFGHLSSLLVTKRMGNHSEHGRWLSSQRDPGQEQHVLCRATEQEEHIPCKSPTPGRVLRFKEDGMSWNPKPPICTLVPLFAK